MRLSGITPLAMVPINPLTDAWTLLVARLNGPTARVPPVFG